MGRRRPLLRVEMRHRSRDHEVMTESVTVAEVAPGVHRLELPLGIHGVMTVSAYLLQGNGADTLVDCGVAAAPTEDGAPGPDGPGALEAARPAGGRGFELSNRIPHELTAVEYYRLVQGAPAGPFDGAGRETDLLAAR